MKLKTLAAVTLFYVLTFSGSANASLLWDWSFGAPPQSVGPTDKVYIPATIKNSSLSTQSLTFNGYGASAQLGFPNAYTFNFGRDLPFPWTSFTDQMYGLQLAPGQSYDFTFGTLAPNGVVPPGTYGIPDFFYGNPGAILSTGDVYTPTPASNSFLFTISQTIETIEGRNHFNLFSSWDYSYDLALTNQYLNVDIDIMLKGDDPGASLRNIWENGIEGIWGNRYEIIDGIKRYPITFNVDWVNNESAADYVVNVHSGSGRDNMLNWYTDDPGGWGYLYQDEVAAHEFGHMLGLYDEYSGGALDPNTNFTTTNALMGDLGPVQDRYYENILGWAEGIFGRKLTLASANAPPYPFSPPIQDFSDGLPPSSVPEPATMLLLGLGLVGLAGARRRIKE